MRTETVEVYTVQGCSGYIFPVLIDLQGHNKYHGIRLQVREVMFPRQIRSPCDLKNLTALHHNKLWPP